MFENIRCDAARYKMQREPGLNGFALWITGWLLGYGLQTVLIYRYGQWVERRFQHVCLLPLRWLLLIPYLFAHWLAGILYGIQISRKARIGSGFYIGHFGGIEVGACKIGKNCSIQQHVKISPGVNAGDTPRIGSCVWIGSYARIEGKITVADRATIAAGAVVKNNIAGGSLVSGNPARVIKKKYDNREILGLMSDIVPRSL